MGGWLFWLRPEAWRRFLAADRFAVAPVVRRGNVERVAQPRVGHAGADAVLYFVQRQAGGDHCRQDGVVAVVDYLVQLLSSPGGRRMLAHVVEYQQRRV